MTTEPYTITDNLDELLAVLPNGLSEAIAPDERARLIEIVLDLGRKPEARFVDRYEYLREEPITAEELAFVEARLGAFGDDNRAGIPATLHRISAIRNRRGAVVGLTLRVGRAVSGIVDILRDLIESGESLLLMGRPGLGKTTLLREMARVLADEFSKRVVIVDTSNEIAGDGDVPHPAIGRARRMQVARVEQQHDVMIEAVENHMPEVVVIDEIGRVEETMAARTIAERGVQLVATVHGNTLDNLLANPTMSDLIGGIQAVTLSDEEARRRRTQKTVLERKAPPTFGVVVEMIERDQIAVRRPVAEVVDAMLRGQPVPTELRRRDENGDIEITQVSPAVEQRPHHEFQTRGFTARRGERSERGERGNRIERGGHSERGGHPERGGRGERWRRDRAGERADYPQEDDESPVVYRKVINGRLERVPSNHSEVGGAALAELDTLEPEAREHWEEESEQNEDSAAADAFTETPLDVSRVRRLYPFGVSRSRLSRAIKQLGVPLSIARTWQDADAVLILTGTEGITSQSSLLREARDLQLPIIAVRGNTYAQILSRINGLFGDDARGESTSPRELAALEARHAIQKVLAEASPVELRPQSKTLRRVQHQLAERYHLRSYSVGREPNRRVRFLPGIRQN